LKTAQNICCNANNPICDQTKGKAEYVLRHLARPRDFWLTESTFILGCETINSLYLFWHILQEGFEWNSKFAEFSASPVSDFIIQYQFLSDYIDAELNTL